MTQKFIKFLISRMIGKFFLVLFMKLRFMIY